ncbi:hypothetical protein [uncultured Bacteroides sp.]|uniref:ISAon1 family transposase N-terminal region protein n=1 Tax=uncultured Bacteroides sp. TaxID=162156 RepID=UPI003748A0AE
MNKRNPQASLKFYHCFYLMVFLNTLILYLKSLKIHALSCLEEKNIVPDEISTLNLHSHGFHPEIEVQDFPIRGKAVYLLIKRRRWKDLDIGKVYSRDWRIVAQGTRITAEFGSFLKELLRQ